ncbi:MAG: hypothetical protein D6765_05565 [Bacteroidetes bacterium]|nr:MAG: hypothetical protein D6765_05565 [Bacteroidota bacterium]
MHFWMFWLGKMPLSHFCLKCIFLASKFLLIVSEPKKSPAQLVPCSFEWPPPERNEVLPQMRKDFMLRRRTLPEFCARERGAGQAAKA